MTGAVHATSFSGRVVGVSKGDCITVLRAGREVEVRLYGIDAPETNQGGCRRATKHAAELALEREVIVHAMEVSDRFGRVVGWVVLPDGRSLNKEMIRAGLAWWYARHAPNDSELQRLEEEARRERRGLWRRGDPIPPWEFRRSQRGNTAPEP